MVLRKSLFIAASFLSLFLVTKADNNQDTVALTKKPFLELYVLNAQMAVLFTQQSPVINSTRTIGNAVNRIEYPVPEVSIIAKTENKNIQPDYSFFCLLNNTFSSKKPYQIYAGFTAWFKKNLFW